LKIDIEGAEREVFFTLVPVLGKVQNLFLEYHCWKDETSFLSKILMSLEENYFDYTIEPIGEQKGLFMKKQDNSVGQQYNIYATKK
jgi:hypothetical protein